jgi:hypothetical protein
LSAVCFRRTNAEVDTLNDRNEVRVCITNHRTTEQDVHRIVEEVLASADRVTARA